MTAVHELGHAIHACVSGGKLVEVELPPRGLGHTQVWPNPHPRFVAWGGACWGCLSPLLIWISARRWAKRSLPLATFFAGMCLIANGNYLAVGGFMGDPNGADDAQELLRHGAARWHLLAFGIPAIGLGLWLWHGLGPLLGAPWRSRAMGWRQAVAMTAVLFLLLLLGTVLAP